MTGLPTDICTLAELRTDEPDGDAEEAEAVEDLRGEDGNVVVENGQRLMVLRKAERGQVKVALIEEVGPPIRFVMGTGRVRRIEAPAPAAAWRPVTPTEPAQGERVIGLWLRTWKGQREVFDVAIVERRGGKALDWIEFVDGIDTEDGEQKDVAQPTHWMPMPEAATTEDRIDVPRPAAPPEAPAPVCECERATREGDDYCPVHDRDGRLSPPEAPAPPPEEEPAPKLTLARLVREVAREPWNIEVRYAGAWSAALSNAQARAAALLTPAGRADLAEELLGGLPGYDWAHSTVVVKTRADFDALVEALGAQREADMLLTSFKPPRVRMSATRGRLSVQVDREAGPEDVLTLLKK